MSKENNAPASTPSESKSESKSHPKVQPVSNAGKEPQSIPSKALHKDEKASSQNQPQAKQTVHSAVKETQETSSTTFLRNSNDSKTEIKPETITSKTEKTGISASPLLDIETKNSPNQKTKEQKRKNVQLPPYSKKFSQNQIEILRAPIVYLIYLTLLNQEKTNLSRSKKALLETGKLRYLKRVL
ncbi:MAG: hypothetical protein HWD61_09720 [Parachlamydiaceae bacterium]|nr:MAG: hypothetical protein HWD61_09720 [Parachlamydiaceae bacterium]